METKFKNITKAIILRGEEVLLIKREKKEHTYYFVPGGEVKNGETEEECLKRELIERLEIIPKHIEKIAATQANGCICSFFLVNPNWIVPSVPSEPQKEWYINPKLLSPTIKGLEGSKFTDEWRAKNGMFSPEWVNVTNLNKKDMLPSFLPLIVSEAKEMLNKEIQELVSREGVVLANLPNGTAVLLKQLRRIDE